MNKVKVAPLKVDLRRGIDHIGVSACAVIHDGHGRILLMKRGAGARDEHGRWDICGGAVEFGESIDEAVRREVMEELCVEPLEIEFLTAYDAHRVHTDGSPTHWVALIHAVRIDPSKVKIGEPHKIDEIGWFYKKDLPEPLHSQFPKSYGTAFARGIVQ
jgi:8-oxo-dGTP pyrophosphatase MutT (NUDIX family)